MSARSTAALLDTPGCVRRNVLDSANVDTARLAAALGGEPQFGQSPFALGRGNRFEARVKENDYAELVEVLRGVGFHLPATLVSINITARTGSSRGHGARSTPSHERGLPPRRRGGARRRRSLRSEQR